MKKVSLLELIHPDGHANISLVLGGNCPKDLLPESSTQPDQTIDLLILAPTVKECMRDEWLRSAIACVEQRLSDDGVCYMLVAPPWRSKLIRLFADKRLTLDSVFWHFPDWTSTHYLIPFQQAPAQFAADKIFSAPSWKGQLAGKMLQHPDMYQLLGTFWKPMGLSIRRPGARPLFQWLFSQSQQHAVPGTAIIRRSWRERYGPEILYCFEGSDALPSMIVKTAASNGSLASLDHEAHMLELLDEGVRSSGAHVPQVLRKERMEQRLSLFLSPLHGRPASDLLASHPDMLCGILTKVVSWLERWHVATVNVQPMDANKLEQAIFIPTQKLAPLLQAGEGYRKWLSQQTLATAKTPLPFVSTHNDLTMANILVDTQLGVVDWETGLADSWPLVDFYYAVTDAVRIAHGFSNWLDAFKACFQPDGTYTQDVRCWENRLRSAIGISTGYSELCFHACWLHHASNEHNVSRPGEPRPFLEIVQWLALNGTISKENRN